MRWLPLMLLAACQMADIDDAPVDTDVDDTDVADPADVPFPIDLMPLTGFVDPRLGTDGPGNAIPGALVPHGMVRLSPDTTSSRGSIDAYEHGDAAIEGFTHTHLEGPGGAYNGYSHVLVLPQVGPLQVNRTLRAVPFSHDNEEARPGYYAVTLDNDVTVELTATGHAGVHRYHLPAGTSRLLVDVGHSNGDSVDGSLTVDGSTISGFGHYNVHPISSLVTQGDGRTAHTRIHLHGELSIAPNAVGMLHGEKTVVVDADATEGTGAWLGAYLEFSFDAPTVVELRMGISRIDAEQAARNLHEEVGEASFDEVAERADEAWNAMLNRVQIEADADTKLQFYTGLYRSYFQPADYREAGDRFVIATSGEDVVRTSKRYRYVTDDWCMWDTFRTSHPLKTLVEPEWVDDIATSLLWAYQEGGWLPKCTWNATGYSRIMIGNHAVPILADAVVKGLDQFNTDLAWEAVEHAGMEEVEGIELFDGLCGYANLGTPPDYLSLGYVPTECDAGQSVSMTLEHAYDDWTAGQLAQALGRTDDAARYHARGGNWRAHYNPAYGFMQAKNRQGQWREPFDPTAGEDFTEASSWIYSFFVPHDVPGLMAIMGGQTAFIDKLDTFFDDGHFAPSNQPSFHIPWLYAAAGQPWHTQSRVRSVLDESYSSEFGGLPGNDDAGSTSAWLVFAQLGFYPLAPGDPRYVITSPRVSKAELFLHPGFTEGGSFVVRTVGDPATQVYIQSATLNGSDLDVPFLDHADIVAGGELVLTLGDGPSEWGAF